MIARRTQQHRRSERRRGAAYVFVLSICLVVTVLAMSAVKISSVSAVATGDANDWEQARSLAFSATEQAISLLNAAAAANPNGWRAAFTSGQTNAAQTLGRAKISWVLKDEIDGNLSADYLRPFRLYGIAKIGNVTRVYSVQVVPAGSPLDVLRTALHADLNVTLNGSVQAVNGPISSNATVSLASTVKASIEAKAVTGSASGTQTITTPAPTKRMPSASVYTTLLQSATVIDYNAIGGGKLDDVLLSPASNPYGATNDLGIYAITVPTGKTLTIANCRIVGTLLVGGNDVNVDAQGTTSWELGPTNLPILVVNSAGASVSLAGKSVWLSENSAGVNFNPAGTPFQGATNTTRTDDYPPYYRGIVHVVAGSSGQVNLSGNAYVIGTVIADCPVKTSNQVTLIQNPAFYANPPVGYASGDAMAEVPGSWRWDTLP